MVNFQIYTYAVILTCMIRYMLKYNALNIIYEKNILMHQSKIKTIVQKPIILCSTQKYFVLPYTRTLIGT